MKRWSSSLRTGRKTATTATNDLHSMRHHDSLLHTNNNGGGNDTTTLSLGLEDDRYPTNTTTATTTATTTTSNNNKKNKMMMMRKGNWHITDDLICPITLELPFQPVTAEDGRIYERAAIEMHFETCRKQRKQVKSPITGQCMGKRLFPSPQAKNLIQALIDHELIKGSLSEAWNKNVFEHAEVDRWIGRARNGDAHAMACIARGHCKGMGGLKKDLGVAYRWCQKSHRAGSCYGTFRLGYHLVYGYGVERKVTEGIMHVLMAAERGSNAAAYWLGMWFANGTCGLSHNPKSAIHWLEISLSSTCSVKTLTCDGKQKARQKLHELLKETIGF